MSWLSSNLGLWLGYAIFLLFCLSVVATIHRKSFREEDFKEIPVYIENLLKYGIKDAYVSFYFTKPGICIFFRKYIHHRGNYGLVLLVPKFDEMAPALTSFQEFCERSAMSLNFFREPAKNFKGSYGQSEEEVDVICVDCERDVDKAYELVKSLTVYAGRMSAHDRYEYESGGGFRLGELVDDPNQRPLTDEEEAEYRVKQIQRAIGLKPLEVMSGGFLYFVQIFGYVGLLYSLILEIIVRLFSIEVSWSLWIINIFGIQLSGKTLDLFLLCLVVIGPLMVFTRGYWRFWRYNLLREEQKPDHTNAQRRRPSSEEITSALSSKVKAKKNVLVILVFLSWIQF